jgi:NADPH:quinone reductase-like Zn-dependent oxidoreductase
VATVRNADLRKDVAALGANAIGPEDTEAHGPYDVILELVGGPNMAANLNAIAIEGRIAIIGTGGGDAVEIGLHSLMMKRASIFGSTLRARPLELKAIAARAVEAHVLPLFAAERLRVPVAATFDLEDVAKAYERFAAGGKFGKIIITML